MKLIQAFISVLLLAGLGFAQLEEIKVQYVREGDYIRQWAVVETDTIRQYCDDCSAYITVRDFNGRLLVNNKSMAVLDRSLYGYKTDNLGRGEFQVRIETISPTYGSGIVYSKAIVGDTGEWINPDAGLHGSSAGGGGGGGAGSGVEFNGDPLNQLIFISEIGMECKGSFLEVTDCEIERSGFTKQVNDVFDPYLETYLLGDLIKVLKWVVVNVFWLVIFVYTLFVLVLTLVGGLFFAIVNQFPNLLGFFIELLSESTRETAFINGVNFILELFSPVINVFLPVIILAQLFIIYNAVRLDDVADIMTYVVDENRRLLMFMVNSIVIFVTLLNRFFVIVYSVLKAVIPW